MTGVLQLFVDECYPRVEDQNHLRVAAIGFYRHQFRRHQDDIARLVQLGAAKQPQAVLEFLRNTRCIGGIQTIRSEDFQLPGRRDYYTDLGDISRADNLWSCTFVFGIVVALQAALVDSGWDFGLLDVYYDRKSLTDHHCGKLGSILARLIKHVHRYYPVRKSTRRLRAFTQVAKFTGQRVRGRHDLGVWLADRLLRLPEQVDPHSLPSGIRRENFTDSVTNLISKLEQLQPRRS